MNALLLSVFAWSGAGGEVAYEGESSAACQTCDAQGGRMRHGLQGARGGCFGPMPQSCYNPSFGCYTSTRFMNRYPAFHGYYYRNAYNHRHYFDYPWHAGLHEPTSHFSYNVPGADSGEAIDPPVPVPTADSAALPRSIVRSAHLQPLGRPTPAQPRTLRR